LEATAALGHRLKQHIVDEALHVCGLIAVFANHDDQLSHEAIWPIYALQRSLSSVEREGANRHEADAYGECDQVDDQVSDYANRPSFGLLKV